MHIWTNPSIECISILTELLCARVFDHISVWEPEPLLISHSLSVYEVQRTMLGKPHSH